MVADMGLPLGQVIWLRIESPELIARLLFANPFFGSGRGIGIIRAHVAGEKPPPLWPPLDAPLIWPIVGDDVRDPADRLVKKKTT